MQYRHLYFKALMVVSTACYSMLPVQSALAAELDCNKLYTVASGDTLNEIAQLAYGDSTKFNIIYYANKKILTSGPAVISLGQKLKIPCTDVKQEAAVDTSGNSEAEEEPDNVEKTTASTPKAETTQTSKLIPAETPTDKASVLSLSPWEAVVDTAQVSNTTPTGSNADTGQTPSPTPSETVTDTTQVSNPAPSDANVDTGQTSSPVPPGTVADTAQVSNPTPTGSNVDAAQTPSLAPSDTNTDTAQTPSPAPAGATTDTVQLLKPGASSATTASSQQYQRKLDLLTASDYAPFTDQDLSGGGLVTEILETALKQSETPYRLNWINDWSAHLDPLLSEKKFDIGFPWLNPGCPGADNPRCDFLFSKPVFELLIVLFTRTEQPLKFTEDDDMLGKALCRPAGYFTHDLDSNDRNWLKEGKITLEQPRNVNDCFDLLMEGKVDAVAINDFTGREFITKLGLKGKVTPLEREISIEGLHALVHKTHPRATILINRINRGMDKLHASGQYDEIIDRHLLNHWMNVESDKP